MGRYTANTLVTVYLLTRQFDGEEIVIGRPDTGVFLALPSEAVELLDCLAEGKTVGESQLIYQKKYGEVPDIEDLLEYLESKGFVEPLVKDRNQQSNFVIQTTTLRHPANSGTVRFHFANFPQSLAQRIFSRPVLVSCGLLIGLALIAIFVKPLIIPGWDAYFFRKNLTLMGLVLLLINYFTTFLHEMAHLVAARAVGVSSRFGISHRMWYLTPETDMTGIWGLPSNQRYLPLLAGILLDAASAAILILVFFAQSCGWLTLNSVVFQLGRAILLTYLLRLLSQCYLFVRTDFYYVIANFFRCKSLMKDTEIFLRNYIAKIIRSIRKVDQSHIPATERRVIRWYAIVWLLGRIAAFGSLIFITIPLIWHYCFVLFAVLNAGYKGNPYAFIDALLMILIVFVPQTFGFWLWIRSFRYS